GIANIVSGTYSFASGGSHTVSGSYSAALGAVNTVSGSYSVAMGCYTTSRAYASVALGRYNDSIASSTTDSWVSTDPLFIIGNGTADNARSNAITVLKNAKTGINTSNPQYGLHVVNANDNDGGYLDGIMLENTSSAANTGEVAISFKNQSFLDANAKWIVGLNQSAIFRIDYGLSFAGNSAMSLDSIGNMTILGTLTQNSDARLKKNITPLQNSLQKILRLNGYHYNWIDSSRSSAVQTGVLAQEIEQEMPELVKTDEAGMKSVNYSGMIPYLIESVKELKQENDQLKMELMQLKSFIKEIAGNKK
ncbi:MAG TPA: tail fiber domain-containing protein, partial [Chitinophagaceae bacterium]|nr:tail fiber domain-containing protein [Chitinophagaceae bacterium]